MYTRVLMLTAAISTAVAVPLLPTLAQTPAPPQVARPSVLSSTARTLTPIAPHHLITPPPVTAPPPGISATVKGTLGGGACLPVANGTPVPLGMASTFDLQTTAQIDAQGHKFGTGTIKFVQGNDLAMWLNQCFSVNALTALTITNVAGTGTVVYVMPHLQVTAADLGTAIGYSFRYYDKISWTVYDANGTAVQSGQQSYSLNQ